MVFTATPEIKRQVKDVCVKVGLELLVDELNKKEQITCEEASSLFAGTRGFVYKRMLLCLRMLGTVKIVMKLLCDVGRCEYCDSHLCDGDCHYEKCSKCGFNCEIDSLPCCDCNDHHDCICDWEYKSRYYEPFV